MRHKMSICIEIPVPWSEQPAIIRAEGRACVIVVAAILIALSGIYLA